MKILNAKNIWLVGASYFFLLGTVNFGATFLYSQLRTIDFLILGFSCLPLLVNKRLFHFVFGSIACFISLILVIACLRFNLDPKVVHTSQFEFNMGYLLTASMLGASIMLIYAAANRADDNRLSLAKNTL